MANVQAPRILICGWAGAGNVGDELLTRELVRRLRSAGAEPVVASRDLAATRLTHPGVAAVRWGPRGARSLAGIDGVVVGPGGILQDSSSLWSLPGHLVLPWLAKRRGAAVRSIGVGAEPLRRRTSARMLRSVLGGTLVMTRDEASTETLRSAGLDAATGADVVFGLELPDIAPRNEIVVSVGPGVGPGRVLPASRRLEPLDVTPIAQAIDRMAGMLNSTVVLTAFRGPRDRDTATALAGELSARTEILDDDVDAHVERTAGARVVISSRYHPVVLAAAAGAPAIVVSNQDKVRSLVEMVANPLVTMVEAWENVGRERPPERGVPAIPSGVSRTLEAIDELASVARVASAARSNRSLG